MISCRAATVTDAPALARIRVEGWRFAYAGLIPQSFLDSMSVEADEKSMRRNIEATQAGNFSLRVAVTETDTVLGLCSAGPHRQDSEMGEIYALYLDPAQVGKGVGKLLMQDALTHLYEAGFTSVALWVLEGNDRAISFYEKAGFSLTGKIKEEQLGSVTLRELEMQAKPKNYSKRVGIVGSQ